VLVLLLVVVAVLLLVVGVLFLMVVAVLFLMVVAVLFLMVVAVGLVAAVVAQHRPRCPRHSRHRMGLVLQLVEVSMAVAEAAMANQEVGHPLSLDSNPKRAAGAVEGQAEHPFACRCRTVCPTPSRYMPLNPCVAAPPAHSSSRS
jgi:hypothetical protein